MNPLLGFTARRSKGPWGVNYRGVTSIPGSTSTGSSVSVQYDLGIAYADRSVWIMAWGSTSGPLTALTVGGVSGSVYATGTYFQAWKFINVPGSLVTINATRYALVPAVFGVYTVTGALNGASVAPEAKAAFSNNDNSVAVSFAARSVGDIFLAIGSKNGGGVGAFDGWSATPVQADIIEDAAPWLSGLGDGGMGRSIEQPGTASASIATSGSDSSKATAQLVLRFSKAP